MTSPSQISATRPTRIGKRFSALAGSGDMGLVAYITAGDPNLAASLEIALAVAEAGADVIELGIPFSDPLADGPTIQRASERSLRAGTTLHGVLDLVAKIRAKSEVPLLLFGYYNPILQMGLENFAARAAAAGTDGVLVTDLIPEEAADHIRIMHGHGLDTVFLAAPTTTPERFARIADASTGFLYLVSRTGVTGARENLPEDLPALVRRARAATKLPLAVGFGISLPGHVSVLGGLADAAVVGSALVQEIERAKSAAEAVANVAARIRSLKEAAGHGLSRRA